MPGNVWSTYGMTETLSHIAMRRVNGPEASPWYTPLPGVTVSSTPDSRLVINAPHLCRKELTTNDIVQFDPHRQDRKSTRKILLAFSQCCRSSL